MSRNQAAPKTPQQTQPLPMKIDVKIGTIRPEGNIRAIASINLNDCFAIRNVKVMDSTKGLFVAMPSYKTGNGEYKDICFPVTKVFREQLNQAVLQSYEHVLTQNHEQNQRKAELSTSDQMPEQNTGIQMTEL